MPPLSQFCHLYGSLSVRQATIQQHELPTHYHHHHHHHHRSFLCGSSSRGKNYSHSFKLQTPISESSCSVSDRKRKSWSDRKCPLLRGLCAASDWLMLQVRVSGGGMTTSEKLASSPTHPQTHTPPTERGRH